MQTITKEIEKLALLIEKDSIDRLEKENMACKVNVNNCNTKIIKGKKYVKINRGSSGFLMIDNEGNIFGIKGYGQIHLSKHYGTLETITDYYWGYYSPCKRNNVVVPVLEGKKEVTALPKKITLATFKKFIKNDNLCILVKSSFSGMSDMVERVEDIPTPIKKIEYDKHTLGISGVWLVGQSRDYFKSYEDNLFKGIEVYNCCGSFIIGYIK